MFLRCFFLLLICAHAVQASCSTLFDCPVCHECSKDTNECVAVDAFTDPNGECPMYCGVRTVCSSSHACVYEERPICDCNWLTGECRIANEEKEEQQLVEISITELYTQGYSDNDVSMIIGILQQEVEHRHAAQDIVVSEHPFEKIVLVIDCVGVLGIIVLIFYAKRLSTMFSGKVQIYKLGE